MRLVRFREQDAESRLGLVEPAAPTRVLELETRDILAALRGAREPTGRRLEALDPETLELPPPFELLAPLVPPETWAAGSPTSAAARPASTRAASKLGMSTASSTKPTGRSCS